MRIASTNPTTQPALLAPLLDLSVRELADIVDGQLSLGTMPPLGGEAEPVRRIVTDSRQVKPGDLFWALPGTTVDGAQFAEDALVRGAQGTVVAGRHIEPWGGCFSIRVADSRQAFLQVARRARQNFAGHVVAVASGPDSAIACVLIDHFLRSRWHGTCHSGPLVESMDYARTFVQRLPQSDYAILEMAATDARQFHEISALCNPQIIAITATQKTTHHMTTDHLAAFADNLARLLISAPSDAVVVLNGDEPQLRSVARKHSTKVLLVGCDSDCDVRATHVCHRDGRLSLLVDDRRFVFPACGRQHLAAALTAIGIGKLLSVSSTSMQTAARSFRQPDIRHRGVSTPEDTLVDGPFEVPSSVSTLREVGATLPPGLERYAR